MPDPFATYPVLEDAGSPVVDPIGLERYRFLRFLSQGGMGEIWQVEDQHLHCTVAMKVVGQTIRSSSSSIVRFQEEAQITAQLFHPAIIPVHDLGILQDGRAYYTMPVVSGPRLSDAIGAWLEEGDDSGWTLGRLIDAFRRICEAIAYAHSRSVIHRDLKPGNVMVGAHGEVLVLDWGLAKIWTRQENAAGWDPVLPEPVTSDRASIPQFQTRAGAIFGTPAYMAPEQARGEGHLAGPPADVYALGAILWEILAGAPPPLQEQPPAQPTRPHGVPELLDLARTALRWQPEDRISARDLVAALLRWQEGAERRSQALKLVAEADRFWEQEEVLCRLSAAQRAHAEQLSRGLLPLDPVEKKRPVWEQQDAAARSDREAQLAHLEVQRLLGAALIQAPDLVEAHDRLAEFYHQEHQVAERIGDTAAALRTERLLTAHDRGAFRAYLSGNGALTLHTEPAGAAVSLWRYVEKDRHLVPVFVRDLGRSPLEAVELPMGSWLLRLEAKGRRPVDYPVLLRRMEHWDGVRPGASESHRIYLPLQGELGENECYVPAGWFQAGGDPEAIYSLPAGRRWVDALVMQRHPVTHRQWLSWMNQLFQSGKEEAALAHIPRVRSVRPEDVNEGYGLDITGFRLIPDADGELWNPDWPVFRVDWQDATLYAEELARESGLCWRLPRDLEWEKAARGVDGRLFPWGNHLDLTFSRSLDSGPGRPLPALATEHPVDCSPYGVRHMAGNIRCWCLDGFSSEPPETLLPPVPVEAFACTRGGSWTAHPRGGRSARRGRDQPHHRAIDLGIRLVRSIG